MDDEISNLGRKLSLSTEEIDEVEIPSSCGMETQICLVSTWDIDKDNANGLWGSSIRIQVRINVTKLIRKVFQINITIVDEQLVSFTYEKLPNLCYCSECLGHLSKGYELQLKPDFNDPGENTPFGPWLRAPIPFISRTRFQASNPQSSISTRHMPTFTIDSPRGP
ncbi:hypothetical protein Salat_0646400 [Sesamum alatum]|uniref:Uncharacterized protein n=1 Tax=Sesamum alatum TaxID=300844 RepID=A0AAE1YQM4_9LAMI|nr:hypothetical protein Salat_0646400 [Sesamum alatum]